MFGDSDAEHRRIVSGLMQDVRGDGRSLCQHRPLFVTSGQVPHASGSSRVLLSGTEVFVTVHTTVVEADVGRLQLHLDWVPTVTARYAQSLGGSNTRYARMFMAHLATVVQTLFGASSFTLEENGTADGVADAEEGEGMEAPSPSPPSSSPASRDSGFPALQLAIGNGFAYQLDADVSVLHADGGNILGAVACALREALRSTQLPFAVVHETPNGVAVEVDRTKPAIMAVDWSSLPLACVMHCTSEYYVVDPSLEEELSLPTRIVIGAAPGKGTVSFAGLQPLPSSRRSAATLRAQDVKTLLGEGVHWCDVMQQEAMTCAEQAQ